MFTYAPNASRAVGRLGELFFQELQTFGRLSACLPPTKETLTPYIVNRAAFILDFLQTLETHCDLRFHPGSAVPFCYNLKRWPETLPVAGYTGHHPDVLPSHVATSLVLNWNLRTTGGLPRRLLMSALWQIAHTDLAAGVTLLLDLHEAGFAAGSDLRPVVALLLQARSAAGSDLEMVERFVGSVTDAEPAAWLEREPDTEWVQPTRLDPGGHAVLLALLQRGSDEIQRVRDAGSLDEWFVGQAHLGGVLETASTLIHELVDPVPLAWRARLSQWEEIEADAYGLLRTTLAGYNTMSLGTIAGYATLVGKTFSDRLGDGWQERFYQQRVLVPTQLRERLLYADTSDIPESWEALSWRIIRPWAAVLRPGDSPDRFRAEPFPADKVLAVHDVQSVFQQHGVSEYSAQHQMLTEHLHSQIDQTFSLKGQQVKAALEEVLPAVLQQLSSTEILDEFAAIHTLDTQHRYQEAVERTHSLLRRYPYLAPAFHEQAIAYDMSGDPEEALQCLVTAIAMDPLNALVWQSLAAVLPKLGSRDEARLATALRAVLEAADHQT